MRPIPDFGTLLRSYREQHGLSQQQVAEQLRREIHDERVRRDEWEKMYNQAIADTVQEGVT